MFRQSRNEHARKAGELVVEPTPSINQSKKNSNVSAKPKRTRPQSGRTGGRVNAAKKISQRTNSNVPAKPEPARLQSRRTPPQIQQPPLPPLSSQRQPIPPFPANLLPHIPLIAFFFYHQPSSNQ
jgi:hypothetical protein